MNHLGSDVNLGPQDGSPLLGPKMVLPSHHQRCQPRVLTENKQVCFPQVVLWFIWPDGSVRAALSCALEERPPALNSETLVPITLYHVTQYFLICPNFR